MGINLTWQIVKDSTFGKHHTYSATYDGIDFDFVGNLEENTYLYNLSILRDVRGGIPRYISVAELKGDQFRVAGKYNLFCEYSDLLGSGKGLEARDLAGLKLILERLDEGEFVVDPDLLLDQN